MSLNAGRGRRLTRKQVFVPAEQFYRQQLAAQEMLAKMHNDQPPSKKAPDSVLKTD